MPDYSLGEISSLATRRVGRRADIPPSTVSQYVNMAYIEVAAVAPHALQERIAVSSTTSGENKIDLPVDFGEPISFSLVWSWSTSSSAISSRKTLARLNVEQADVRGPYPAGTPEAFLLYNDWLELYPSPNSGYSLYARYRSQVTDMTALSDVPSLSTPWRHAVLLRAEALLHEDVGNAAGSAAAFNRYLSYVHTLKSDEARRQSGAYRHHMAPVYDDGT